MRNPTNRSSIRTWLVIVLLIGFLVPASVSYAQQNVLKLGFIDVDEVMKNWKKYQNTINQVKDLYLKKRTELLEQKQSLQKEFESFDLQKELMPEDSVKKRMQELMMERKDYEDMIKRNAQEFQEEQSKRLDPLVDEIKKVVETIAKRENYSFIWPKNIVFYCDPKFDLTQQVIQELNK